MGRFRRITALVAAGCALAAAGCGMTGRAVAVDVDGRAWCGAAELAMDNDGTTALCDIELFVRCNARFDEDTLTLDVVTLRPDSLRCRERVRLTTAGDRRAAALRREVRAIYRTRVRMERGGVWRWRVEPCRAVRGVEAVGIRIEKSK